MYDEVNSFFHNFLNFVNTFNSILNCEKSVIKSLIIIKNLIIFFFYSPVYNALSPSRAYAK